MERAVTRPIPLEIAIDNEESAKGLLIALSLITTWIISLVTLLSFNLSNVHLFSIVFAVFFQTFLYAGIFITAHDAMHRSLFPGNPKVNDCLGTACVFLYAFFSYKKLLKNHWLHHRYPASDRDPDFHDGHSTHPISWFLTFIKRYYGWPQLIAASIAYYVATGLLHVSELNLVLFWIVPALLSSVQLFYFGTFLPHHEPQGGYTNVHRARSNSLPIFWSLLSCYHFGYHEEHHEHPSVPWWQLPAIRKLRIENASARVEPPAQ